MNKPNKYLLGCVCVCVYVCALDLSSVWTLRIPWKIVF